MLVVEDEPSIADVLAIALRYHRFEVMAAGTVREALALAERTRPDAALLDVMLPDGDGRALGRELRAAAARPGRRLPHRAGRARRDRRRARLRRRLHHQAVQHRRGRRPDHRGPAPHPARPTSCRSARPCATATWSWTRRRTRVHRAGSTVELTPTEYALLRFLVRNGGRIVPKEQLLRHVWQYEHTPPESTVVETYISYLRRKLGPLGPPVITTRRGVGYGLA